MAKMNIYDFDCTQFLSFNREGNVSVDLVVAELKDTFQIIKQRNIEEEKLLFLEPFLQSNTVELFNQEFGSFDIWYEKEKVPDDIAEFASRIWKIHENEHIRDVTLILIDYVDCTEEVDKQVVFKEFYVDDIFEGLYYFSCFGNARNVILRFLK